MKKKHIKLIIILFWALILISFFLTITRVLRVKYSADTPYFKEYVDVLQWLKLNSDPNDIVLTEWTEGHQVVALANRKVIATSKVYPSEAKKVAKRYEDLAQFFFASNEQDAKKIVDFYNVKWLFLRKKFDFLSTCKGNVSCNKEGSFATQLLDKKIFKNFKLVFESTNFLIYRLI